MKRSIEPQIARCTITGAFFGVVVDVERAEPFRQVEVDLRGAALPVAADGVAQHIFELRAVERAFAIDRGPDAGLTRRAPSPSPLGLVPHRVGADALFGPVESLTAHVLEAEIGVGRQDQVVDLEALRRRAVLRCRTHARRPG